jgi:hypothetical protein
MSQTEYSKIATKIRKAFDKQDKNLLNKTLEDLLGRFESYQAALEVVNKKCCDISQRYLEVEKTESSVSKLTVNASTGRFTLKVSVKTSEKVESYFRELAKEIMEEELPPISLRGKIEFYRGGYQTNLTSNSGKFKHFKRIEEKTSEEISNSAED